MSQKIYDQVEKLGYYALLEGTDRQGAGDTWFVDSQHGSAANNANSGTGASWSAPFANLNYAISRCSDGARDVIFVSADHVESWSTAETASGTTTTGCCVDKNDVTIIGLGTGDSRPTFTFTAAAGTMYIDAYNVSIYNCIFYSNFANHASHIDAQANADGLYIEGCKFHDASAVTETVSGIILTANCDDVTIYGNKFYNVDTNDGSDEAILLEGGSDRIRIIDNVFDGDWNEEVINMNTAASTEIEVTGNYCNNVDAGFSCFIATHSSCTGVISDNTIYCPATGSAGGVIADTVCLKANNRITTTLAVEAGDSTRDTSGLHQVYYCDSGTGVDTNDGLSWENAFATIGAAIDACTADNGDIIYVAAGHAQNLTGAGTTTEMDVDCNGISIIGLGVGANRPTFTMITDTANALCDMSANNCLLENLRFLCNIDDGDGLVLVNGTECTIKNCYFGEGGQVPDFCVVVGVGDADSNDLLIEGCTFDIPTADSNDAAITVNKDMDGLIFRNNIIRTDSDLACIDIPTAGDACTNLTIEGNIITNLLTGQHCIQIDGAAVTGRILNNTLICDTREATMTTAICETGGNKWSKLGTGMDGIDNVDHNIAGRHFFVNSSTTGAGTTAGHGYSWAEPLSTIEQAIQLCTADAGDVIHVGPGHEETLTNSVFIDFDKDGITCIGHGQGANKPLITYDHADAEIQIGANDITIKGLRMRPSVDGVTNGVLIEDGFDNLWIEDCEFGFPEDATDEFACAIATGDATNNVTITKCKFMAGAQAAVSAIDLLKDTDHTTISYNLITGAYSTAPIRGATTASTYLDIHHNTFMTTGATDTFNLVAASTGMIHDNRIVMNAASAANAMDVGNCWCIENYLIADDDVGGAKSSIDFDDFASVTATADD